LIKYSIFTMLSRYLMKEQLFVLLTLKCITTMKKCAGPVIKILTYMDKFNRPGGSSTIVTYMDKFNRPGGSSTIVVEHSFSQSHVKC